MTRKPPTSAQALQPKFSRSSTICPLSLRGRICCSAAPGPARWLKLPRQGKPAIFVPFPRAADDHQRVNAQALERAGAAVVLEETKLDEVWLVETVSNLLGDSFRLGRMSQAAQEPGTSQSGKGHRSHGGEAGGNRRLATDCADLRGLFFFWFIRLDPRKSVAKKLTYVCQLSKTSLGFTLIYTDRPFN